MVRGVSAYTETLLFFQRKSLDRTNEPLFIKFDIGIIMDIILSNPRGLIEILSIAYFVEATCE